MLTIKAEGTAGMDLREAMLPEMLALAQRTGAAVEVRANDTLFRVRPTDDMEDLRGAYDRLYPDSRMVTTGMVKPWPREKT